MFLFDVMSGTIGKLEVHIPVCIKIEWTEKIFILIKQVVH
jgi:hypothetical protein